MKVSGVWWDRRYGRGTGEEDGEVADEAGAASVRTGRDGSHYRLRLVRHDPADFGRFYNEFANPALWFLQHEMAELVERPSDDAWESYGRVNANVAAAVALPGQAQRNAAGAVGAGDGATAARSVTVPAPPTGM